MASSVKKFLWLKQEESLKASESARKTHSQALREAAEVSLGKVCVYLVARKKPQIDLRESPIESQQRTCAVRARPINRHLNDINKGRLITILEKYAKTLRSERTEIQDANDAFQSLVTRLINVWQARK